MAVLILKGYQEAEQFVTAMKAINPINLALGKEGREEEASIDFFRFYVLKLMSFFWFYLRFVCN